MACLGTQLCWDFRCVFFPTVFAYEFPHVSPKIPYIDFNKGCWRTSMIPLWFSPLIFPLNLQLAHVSPMIFPWNVLLPWFHEAEGKDGWKLRAGDQPNHEETIAATALLIQGLAMKYGFEPLKIWGLFVDKLLISVDKWWLAEWIFFDSCYQPTRLVRWARIEFFTQPTN